MTYLTTSEVAEHFRCPPKTVRRIAQQFGIGMAFGRRVGYRFSEADVAAMAEALRPAASEESA